MINPKMITTADDESSSADLDHLFLMLYGDLAASPGEASSMDLPLSDDDSILGSTSAIFDSLTLNSSTSSIKDNNKNATRRGRSPTPSTPNRPRKRISVKEVDVDAFPSHDAQHQLDLDDLSICSFNTAQTSQDHLNSSFTSLMATTSPDEQQAKYHSALASLADSMKKTESSRRQVMLQRSLLTPEQRASLEEARNRQLQAIQTEALIPVQTQHHVRDLSPTRSNIMNQFFSGSRGTLTNGLEQSRRQLKSYMSQVQNQTL